jgi:ribosome-binding protein aMBF1 (putative translation factor)
MMIYDRHLTGLFCLELKTSRGQAMKKGETQKTPIRWARFVNQISQDELAAKAGMGQSKLSYIERGLTKATAAEQARIAECLGMKPDELDFSLKYEHTR